MMKTGKNIFFAIIILIFVSTVSNCERENLYDLAKNGIPKIYAITSTGTEYKLIIATSTGYMKEYMTGIPDGGPVNELSASADGDVVFCVGTTYYAGTGDSYSDWSTVPPPSGNINGTCGDKRDIYAQVTDTDEFIYRLDPQTKTWQLVGQINIAAGSSFVRFFYSRHDSSIYLYRFKSSPDTLFFYRIENGSAILEGSSITTFTSGPVHSLKYGDRYYAADTTSYLRIYSSSAQIVSAAAPVSSPSYAVLNNSSIFAGSTSTPNVYLYRFDVAGANWTGPAFTINLGTGAMIRIKDYDENTLAVGMSSSAAGGLYYFDVLENSLNLITPMKILFLEVK